MEKTITSVQNNKIKERSKLKSKKARMEQNCFLVEGKHLIQEAIQSNILIELYLLENIENPFDFKVTYCSQPVMNKLSNQKSDAKMIGICKFPSFENKKEKAILLLDDIQDPGNMGTLVRSAYSFGFDAIYLSNNCADLYNPKTIQSSQGSIFHLPAYQCDLSEIIQGKQKAGMTIYATALHNNTMDASKVKIHKPYGILLGNEGQGVKPELIELCNQCVKIEMETFESLNVAVAGSILMYSFQYLK